MTNSKAPHRNSLRLLPRRTPSGCAFFWRRRHGLTLAISGTICYTVPTPHTVGGRGFPTIPFFSNRSMKASILPLMALGCCLPAPFLTACGDGGKPAAAQAADPQDAVSVFHILPKRVQDTRDWYGQTSATGKQEIHPRITGTVQEIHYTEGARVKKGDLLYTLDPTLFQAELERARANLKAAEAATQTARAQVELQRSAVRKAKLDLERTRYGQGNVDRGVAARPQWPG